MTLAYLEKSARIAGAIPRDVWGLGYWLRVQTPPLNTPHNSSAAVYTPRFSLPSLTLLLLLSHTLPSPRLSLSSQVPPLNTAHSSSIFCDLLLHLSLSDSCLEVDFHVGQNHHVTAILSALTPLAGLVRVHANPILLDVLEAEPHGSDGKLLSFGE